MRPRGVAIAVAVLAAAAICVRLGMWQLSRLHEKQALNAGLRRMLERPVVEVADVAALPESLRLRRVRLRGRYDERRQVLLSGQFHAGTQGVHVLTPLVLDAGGRKVLVDRGWIPAEDAVTARPQDLPVPGRREVVGIASPFPRSDHETPIRTLETDSVTLLSMPDLDGAALARRLGPGLAPFLVTELPGAGGAAIPWREAPPHYDEFMHLSYAVQWFAFAAILLAGSAGLAWSRRSARTPTPPGSP